MQQFTVPVRLIIVPERKGEIGMKFRLFCFLMALMFILSGCSSDDSNQEALPEFVYTATLMDMPDSVDDINQIIYNNGKLYLNCYINDEEKGHMTAIGVMNTDGSEFSFVDMPTPKDEKINFHVNGIVPVSNGNMWIAGEEGYFDEANEEYINNNYLILLDSQGNEINRVLLHTNNQSTSTDNTSSSLVGAAMNTDYFYVDKLAADSNDNIYIQSNSQVYVFNNEGKLLFTLGDENGSTWISGMAASSDGFVYVRMHGAQDPELRRIDVDKKEFSEALSLPENMRYADELYSGHDYDLYVNDYSSLFGITVNDDLTTEAVEILNWVDSDIDSNNIQNVTCLDNDSYLVCCWDENWSTELNIITKQKYEETEKEIITLGTLEYGNLRSSVVKFNKTNDKYRIKLKEYFNDDYQAAINAINTDIITGNAPDIIELNALSADTYISKGLLEDLYPYFDNDAYISRDDYLQSVLKALETDGKLYSITPSFSIQTVLGRASAVGAEPRWTLDELYSALDAQPEGTIAFANATKAEMLSIMCMMNIDNFIDYQTGKCSFDSDEFIELLEFANMFENDVDYSSDDYESELTQVYNGKAMLYPASIHQIEDFQFVKEVLGDDLTFIGFPSKDSSGTVLVPSERLGISARSKHKDGAWEFIKYLLTDEYQSNRNHVWAFPINNYSLDQIFEEAMTPNTYIDENGNEVESPKMGMGMDDFMVDIMAATQEEVDEIKALMDSIDSVYTMNTSVLDLITEDAQYFFEGQKSATDVASVIQNRVQTYINESR